jgi:hypothetical protein
LLDFVKTLEVVQLNDEDYKNKVKTFFKKAWLDGKIITEESAKLFKSCIGDFGIGVQDDKELIIYNDDGVQMLYRNIVK